MLARARASASQGGRAREKLDPLEDAAGERGQDSPVALPLDPEDLKRVREDSGLLPGRQPPHPDPEDASRPRSGSMNKGFTRRQWPQ